MKNWLCVIIILLCNSCNKDETNTISKNETDINIVTGISIRNSELSQITKLGNPNTYSNNQFTVYPNPPSETVNISSIQNISSVWIIPANAEKIFQETEFNTIFTPNLYVENEIKQIAVSEFTELETTNLVLNLESLEKGYYRVFVKINDMLYWDNIYLADSNFEINNIINFWN